MKKYILTLILGLIIAMPILAATTTPTVVQLLEQIVRLQSQLLTLLRQRQLTPTVPPRQMAAVFYSTAAPIRLEYVQAVASNQRNLIAPGAWVSATGTGFTSVMKVIISGQAANEQAYTYVLTAYPASGTNLSFLMPADAPAGILDIHLADGTIRTSRVSKTLLVEVVE